METREQWKAKSAASDLFSCRSCCFFFLLLLCIRFPLWCLCSCLQSNERFHFIPSTEDCYCVFSARLIVMRFPFSKCCMLPITAVCCSVRLQRAEDLIAEKVLTGGSVCPVSPRDPTSHTVSQTVAYNGIK